jgi:voltage-gated potassium channel
VAFICSTALFLAESGVNEGIDEPLDALWWGVTTLTTVGYGDVIPVTLEGRLAAGGLMLIGITLFAAITGTITSALIASRGGSGRTAAERLRDLAALRDEGLVTDEEYALKRPRLVEEL